MPLSVVHRLVCGFKCVRGRSPGVAPSPPGALPVAYATRPTRLRCDESDSTLCEHLDLVPLTGAAFQAADNGGLPVMSASCHALVLPASSPGRYQWSWFLTVSDADQKELTCSLDQGSRSIHVEFVAGARTPRSVSVTHPVRGALPPLE